MSAMQRELRLDRQPRHIECFDNSNLQGTNPVASCVVFRDGKPSRKEYRHYNVKTVVGADDFASMREIVYRRYRRLLDEGAELPDLIIVDGGKGQLSSAYGVLCELGLAGQVPVVGLAKRIEEIFYPGDPMPYYLSRTGEPLKVVCHIRDEAHRFGITFHRQKRSKSFIHSELEQIPGIGNRTIQALLRRTYDFAGQNTVLEHRGALLNLGDATLTCGETRVDLTKNELKILQVLMENKEKIVSRDTLMTKLWESDSFVDENTLSVNVGRLRKKLDAAGLPDFILTKKGIGYHIG